MNILEGQIKEIKVNGELSIVMIDVDTILVSTIVIDTPDTASFLKINEKVKVLFKETEVILGVGSMSGISLRNKFEGKVIGIDSDKLLSKVKVETSVGELSSIITTNAVEQLKIQVGSFVTAMIKTNELMLSKW